MNVIVRNGGAGRKPSAASTNKGRRRIKPTAFGDTEIRLKRLGAKRFAIGQKPETPGTGGGGGVPAAGAAGTGGVGTAGAGVGAGAGAGSAAVGAGAGIDGADIMGAGALIDEPMPICDELSYTGV
jgi:hypothetical protein